MLSGSFARQGTTSVSRQARLLNEGTRDRSQQTSSSRKQLWVAGIDYQGGLLQPIENY
eukprot:COSAG01_NODE_852_length_13108_cov_7.167423_17_plen_58_part_00